MELNLAFCQAVARGKHSQQAQFPVIREISGHF
jgi:hypothetical protein